MSELSNKIGAFLKTVKIEYRGGYWFKGKGTTAFTDEKMYNALPQDIKNVHSQGAVADAIRELEEIEELLNELPQEEASFPTETYIRDFLVKYKELLLEKWTVVDEDVYSGLKYTMDDDIPLILAPTGKGKEYTIVGRTDKDLYATLACLPIEGSNISRLKYIENCIVNPILSLCFPGAPQHPDVIDNQVLSSSALDTMYGKNAVFEGTTLIGYSFKYIGGKPSVMKYIQCSMESFLANPDNYIKNIKPVSNDSNVATYRYIPLNMQKGDWSAYMKWFKDSFTDYKMQGKVFMNQIGAMLDADNTSKQGAWLRGYGDDGKSTVLNCIGKFVGTAFKPIDTHLFASGFGMAQFDGTRMGVISDSKNPKHVGSNWYHKITGQDPYVSNEKNEKPITMIPITHMFFAENIDPIVNVHEDNQMSRIILYRFKKKTDQEKIDAGIAVRDSEGTLQKIGNTEWPKLLEAQCEAFLAACLEMYFGPNTLCPNRSQIMVPQAMQDHIINGCSDESDDSVEYAIYSEYVEGTEADFVSRSDIHDNLKQKLDKKWDATRSPQLIRLLIEKEFGGKLTQRRINGVGMRGYTHIKLKTWTGTGDSSFKLVESKSESQQLHGEYIHTVEREDEWLNK